MKAIAVIRQRAEEGSQATVEELSAFDSALQERFTSNLNYLYERCEVLYNLTNQARKQAGLRELTQDEVTTLQKQVAI